MPTFFSLLPEDLPEGLVLAGLNLIVALGLILVSVVLGVAISIIIGLPAVVTAPERAIQARLTGRLTK